MDTDLQTAIFEAIEDLAPRNRLPRSELRHIAEEAVACEKVTDGEWLFQRVQISKKEFLRKRNIARIRGYAPFNSLNQRVYSRLNESFGPRTLELMKTHLADPEDIYGKWAYRFAHTVHDIGIEECESKSDQLYNFVISHPQWKENTEKLGLKYKDWLNEGRVEKPQKNEAVAENEVKEEISCESAQDSAGTAADQKTLAVTSDSKFNASEIVAEPSESTAPEQLQSSVDTINAHGKSSL